MRRPKRERSPHNKALQRIGAKRFSFMSHWFYHSINSGGRALSAPVAELGSLTSYAHESKISK
jgi:hypothetical protein